MSTTSTILIIDDDDCIRRLCLRILKKLNYTTMEAETGQVGYDLFADHVNSVAAILLDLNLPDGSGINWAEKLQALKAEIPVIFFTGTHHMSSMKVDHARRFFLKKPFTPDDMSAVLNMAIEAVSA
ncbi:MAG: response regulator [Kiritimatiellia bacterium]